MATLDKYQRFVTWSAAQSLALSKMGDADRARELKERALAIQEHERDFASELDEYDRFLEGIAKPVLNFAIQGLKAKRAKVYKRVKVAVFLGFKEKTYTGMKKSDLVKNKRGRIVSKKASDAGKKAYCRIQGWTTAVQLARLTLGVTGFVAVKTGTPLYTKAKEIYRGTKEVRRAPYDDYPMKAVKDTKEWVTIPNWEPFGT
jgi:hypothetical protein